MSDYQDSCLDLINKNLFYSKLFTISLLLNEKKTIRAHCT